MKLYNKTNLESLQLPPDFERISARELKEIIGYGKGYNGYRFCNEETIGLVTCSEGKKNEIPYSAQALIKELHKAMEENEGLIEVKEGTSEKGNHYIYLIRKEREGDAESFFASIAYTMQMCIAKNNRHLYVDSKFFEDGLSGGRDTAVFGVFRSENPDEELDELMERWMQDPYDPDYRKGFLMNRSEAQELDESFPEHPLSVARKLAEFIVTNN